RIGACRHRHLADQTLIPRRAYFDRFTLAPLFAAKQKSRLRSRTHLHKIIAPRFSLSNDDGNRAGRAVILPIVASQSAKSENPQAQTKKGSESSNGGLQPAKPQSQIPAPHHK